MTPKHALAFFCIMALLGLPLGARAPEELSPPARTFLLDYEITLKDLPTNAQRVQVWIPQAVTDQNQTVVVKEIKAPVRLHEMREPLFGNHIFYGEIQHPAPGPLRFAIQYEVTRKQYSKGNYHSLMNAVSRPAAAPGNLARFLAPDRLVPTDGSIKELADGITRGKQGPLEKAHALYDYVFQTVRYDKSGTGWGRGDSLWVCKSKHGNCTDFHSLFISLARAEGIPARFEIGFPVPGATEGTIPGYHCWAEFFLEDAGWVPVDISEAWKDPKKHDYFFGSLDADRVQFSVGRDLTLQPKQEAGPLNYFVYPYVEVNGKPFEGIEKKFSYQDVDASGRVRGRDDTH